MFYLISFQFITGSDTLNIKEFVTLEPIDLKNCDRELKLIEDILYLQKLLLSCF